MKLKFAASGPVKSGVLVLFSVDGGKLAGKATQEADQAAGGRIAQALKLAGHDGKRDQIIDLPGVGPGEVSRTIVIGLGDAARLEKRDVEMTGGLIAGALQSVNATAATVLADLPGGTGVDAGDAAALLASGAHLRSYSFLKYKTRNKPARPRELTLTIQTADLAGARKAFQHLEAVAEGVHLARDLVNEPANILFPAEFAARARTLASSGLKVEILTPAQMQKLGMGALLGVAQGSAHEARLVVMQWTGGKKGARPVAFIGKGVTFDTGGISIKPAAGMEDMKGDMGGAACVTGLMLALAKRKARVNAIGVIGLVENMPSGMAQRPGDVVTSMSGQTIAVLNTDAEGRLVLADALWYTQDRFKPQVMVNLATLTGAIMVALGKEHAGLFSNNDQLSQRLTEAGLATGEKVWRMPLGADYDKMIDSDIADMKNIGGRNAGAITAAQFLQRFVNGTAWAHLDIAGTAMDSGKTAINQSWGSGWGVRLLDRMVAEHYEG